MSKRLCNRLNVKKEDIAEIDTKYRLHISVAFTTLEKKRVKMHLSNIRHMFNNANDASVRKLSPFSPHRDQRPG